MLGLDAVYDPESGKLDEKRTDIWVSNRFLARKVKELNERLATEKDPEISGKRFFYGGSVNPNRRDWREELEFVIGDPNAVLLKLIPSAQHIHLRDPKHKPFYETSEQITACPCSAMWGRSILSRKAYGNGASTISGTLTVPWSAASR